MLKTFLFLGILLLNFSQLQAQNITGKIVEKESGEALLGANISLKSIPDSSRVAGTTSNIEGEFEIEAVAAGQYYLEVSFIGFNTYSSAAFALKKDKSFGKIPLTASSILMDEVSIQSDVINKIDKKVYPVQDDMLSETGTATQILQNIPSVDVDISGGISLRNAGVAIFLNGRPSAILQRNPNAFLTQLPAKMIEKIEVITNPSAKYKPDGVGGIINIVLKKERKSGLNGQVSANVGFQDRYNGGLNLNYGTEDLNFFGNYGIRHSNPTALSTDERIFINLEEGENDRYFEDGRNTSNSLSQTIYAGTSWEINDYNSMEVSGNYFVANSDHSGKSNIAISDSQGTINSDFQSISTNDEYEAEGELQLSVEHVFKNNEDHTLEFEAVFASFDEREDQQFTQLYTIPDSSNIINNNLVQKSGNEQEISINYVVPVAEDAEIEVGYDGEFSYQDIRYTRDEMNSRFLFNRNLHAIYAQYSQPLGDFEFKAGLRGEESFTKGKVKQPIDSVVKNNDFRLFPTLHLQYDLNESSLLALSYSRRINRPDADMLNPNPEFTDPRNAEAGNSHLQPEQVHSIELGYQTGKDGYSLTSSLYYRNRYDAFTGIQLNVGDTLIMGTIENINTQQSVGLEVNLSKQFTENWDTSISGDVFYTRLDAGNLGYKVRNHGISGNLKAHSYSKLGDNTSLQFDAFYYFPRLSPQGRREGFFYINAGIKENLLNDKASITLIATDVFHTYKIHRKTEAIDFYQNSTYQRLQPVVSLGFSWRFNQFDSSDEIEYGEQGI